MKTTRIKYERRFLSEDNSNKQRNQISEAVNVNQLQAFLIKNTKIDRNKLTVGEKTMPTALGQTLSLLETDSRYVDTFTKNLLQFNKWMQKATGQVPMEQKVAEAIGIGMFNNTALPSRITVTDSGKFYIATFSMSGVNALYNLIGSEGFAPQTVRTMLPIELQKAMQPQPTGIDADTAASRNNQFNKMSQEFYSKWGSKPIPLQKGRWSTWEEVEGVKQPTSIQFTPNGPMRTQTVTGFRAQPEFAAPLKVVITIAVPK